MSEETYSGVCVGGPLHGQQIECRAPFLRVPVLPEGWPVSQLANQPDLKIVEYRHAGPVWVLRDGA